MSESHSKVTDVADELRACVASWDPAARVIGNVRAEDIGRVAAALIETQAALARCVNAAADAEIDAWLDPAATSAEFVEQEIAGLRAAAALRLIGWRVRWEAQAINGWTPCAGQLTALPIARKFAATRRVGEKFGSVRNVRIVRVSTVRR